MSSVWCELILFAGLSAASGAASPAAAAAGNGSWGRTGGGEAQLGSSARCDLILSAGLSAASGAASPAAAAAGNGSWVPAGGGEAGFAEGERERSFQDIGEVRGLAKRLLAALWTCRTFCLLAPDIMDWT